LIYPKIRESIELIAADHAPRYGIRDGNPTEIISMDICWTLLLCQANMS